MHDVIVRAAKTRSGAHAGARQKRPSDGEIAGAKPVTGGKADDIRIVFLVTVVARRINRDAMAARSQFLRGRLDTDGDTAASRFISVTKKRDVERAIRVLWHGGRRIEYSNARLTDELQRPQRVRTT